MLAGMRRRAFQWQRWLLWAACAALSVAHAAVPLGYRYVGSRLVSAGRVVYWYWNVDYVEFGDFGASFVARMYARAVDVDQERPFIAVIRCDSRTYRALGSTGPFEAIDEDEPIAAVQRAGCTGGHAATRAERYAQLTGTAAAPAATPAVPVAPPDPIAAIGSAKRAPAVDKVKAVATTPVPPSVDAGDPRRADRCLHFAETKPSPGGDAAITNTCAFPIEVTLCYKGAAGGIYDCPVPAKGKHADSLGPGVTHALAEYRRGRQKGIAAVACKGTLGSVFPRLDDTGGKSGCF